MGFYSKDQLALFLTFSHIYWKNFANVLIWKQCQAGTFSNLTSVIIAAVLITHSKRLSRTAKSSRFVTWHALCPIYTRNQTNSFRRDTSRGKGSDLSCFNAEINKKQIIPNWSNTQTDRENQPGHLYDSTVSLISHLCWQL